MEFRNDCDVYRDRSVRASWKVPAFCCNDWGALKLLEICSAFGLDVVDFKQMGIDHIFIDESHQFKNLTFNTRHDRVAGLGNSEGSQKALKIGRAHV